eukprot:92471-Rhodomonas_salina.1
MDIGSVLHWRLSSPVPHTLFSQSFQADQGLTGGCVDPRVRVLSATSHTSMAGDLSSPSCLEWARIFNPCKVRSSAATSCWCQAAAVAKRRIAFDACELTGVLFCRPVGAGHDHVPL